MLVDVDGPLPSLVELLRQRVVSYPIALWSSVAAFIYKKEKKKK